VCDESAFCVGVQWQARSTKAGSLHESRHHVGTRHVFGPRNTGELAYVVALKMPVVRKTVNEPEYWQYVDHLRWRSSTGDFDDNELHNRVKSEPHSGVKPEHRIGVKPEPSPGVKHDHKVIGAAQFQHRDRQRIAGASSPPACVDGDRQEVRNEQNAAVRNEGGAQAQKSVRPCSQDRAAPRESPVVVAAEQAVIRPDAKQWSNRGARRPAMSVLLGVSQNVLEREDFEEVHAELQRPPSPPIHATRGPDLPVHEVEESEDDEAQNRRERNLVLDKAERRILERTAKRSLKNLKKSAKQENRNGEELGKLLKKVESVADGLLNEKELECGRSKDEKFEEDMKKLWCFHDFGSEYGWMRELVLDKMLYNYSNCGKPAYINPLDVLKHWGDLKLLMSWLGDFFVDEPRNERGCLLAVEMIRSVGMTGKSIRAFKAVNVISSLKSFHDEIVKEEKEGAKHVALKNVKKTLSNFLIKWKPTFPELLESRHEKETRKNRDLNEALESSKDPAHLRGPFYKENKKRRDEEERRRNEEAERARRLERQAEKARRQEGQAEKARRIAAIVPAPKIYRGNRHRAREQVQARAKVSFGGIERYPYRVVDWKIFFPRGVFKWGTPLK